MTENSQPASGGDIFVFLQPEDAVFADNNSNTPHAETEGGGEGGGVREDLPVRVTVSDTPNQNGTLTRTVTKEYRNGRRITHIEHSVQPNEPPPAFELADGGANDPATTAAAPTAVDGHDGDEERAVITAVPFEEEEEKSKCTKNNVIKVLAGLGIIAIIVTLIMIFAVKKEETATGAPTGAPTQLSALLQELLLKYFDTPLHSDALTWLTDEDTWSPPEDSKTTVVTGPNGEDQLLWEALWVERYALAALYYETNGEGWTVATGWLSDQSVCNWYNQEKTGYCNANGQIKNLFLCKS